MDYDNPWLKVKFTFSKAIQVRIHFNVHLYSIE